VLIVSPARPGSNPGSLSFGAELNLTEQPAAAGGVPHFTLDGTAADCVLCAVDQKAGLMAAMDLSPVLVVVGVDRGPALSSGAVVGVQPPALGPAAWWMAPSSAPPPASTTSTHPPTSHTQQPP
jgi:hypothetical protein